MSRIPILGWFINGFKGLFIGIANTIPGVSGGTIAVITGIYEPLIDFFASFFSRKKSWKDLLGNIAPLLVPVIIGVFAGILLFANIIDYLFTIAPSQTQFLFIGLILGSLPYLVKQSKKSAFKISYLIPFLLCAALLVWMSTRAAHIPDRSVFIHTQNIIRELTPINVLILIGGGMLSTGAMIIPGVSGSFVMVVIGLYATFKTMVVELNAPVIACFLIGAFSGLFLFSKGISFLLNKFHGPSYYAILGLVIGSIAFLWPGLRLDSTGLASIAFLIVGFFVALFLSASRKDLLRAKTPAVDTHS